MLSIMLIIYEMNFSSTEMEELANHGITLPPNMQGLTEDQIEDLKLKDEWAEKCVPQGGVRENKDPIGRRNGQGDYCFELSLCFWLSQCKCHLANICVFMIWM